jgi:guanylate kinase
VAQVELSQKEKYDYLVMNDDLDRATNELVAYIESKANQS